MLIACFVATNIVGSYLRTLIFELPSTDSANCLRSGHNHLRAGFPRRRTVHSSNRQQNTRLVPMNRLYDPIDLPEDADLEVFGVATTVIHSLRNT